MLAGLHVLTSLKIHNPKKCCGIQKSSKEICSMMPLTTPTPPHRRGGERALIMTVPTPPQGGGGGSQEILAHIIYYKASTDV